MEENKSKSSTSGNGQGKTQEKESFWDKVKSGISSWWDSARDGYIESNDPKFNGGGYGGV